MSNFYGTCLCNATEKGGSTTTADERVEKCKATRAEQLYYTNYDAEDNPGEVSPIFPKTHAKVVLYGSSGSNIEDVINSMKVTIDSLKASLQSMGKHHLRIADDLVTDSAVIALSARQGKRLAEMIEVMQGNSYASLTPVDNDGYLYTADYNGYKFEDAMKYYKERFKFIPAGCTSFKTVYREDYGDDWIWRPVIAHNYDGVYDEYVDVVVKTPHVDGYNAITGFNARYAVTGIASKVTDLTHDVVKKVYDTNTHVDTFDAVPYAIVEGMNEKGLVCHLNLVKAEKEESLDGILPSEEERIQLYANMLPRFILDHFATAAEAVDYITKYVHIILPTSTIAAGYDYHIFLSDDSTTYAIEWWGGEYHVDETEVCPADITQSCKPPVMTNFYITDVELNDDGEVYTPQAYTHNKNNDPVEINHVTLYGKGLERYNLVKDAVYDRFDSQEDLLDFLQQIKYSVVYSKDIHLDGDPSPVPFWFTEFVGGNLTTHTTTTTTEWWSTIDAEAEKFNNRVRVPGSKNFGSWHTIHSVIYNLELRTMQIVAQEKYDQPYMYRQDVTVNMQELWKKVDWLWREHTTPQ